MHELLQSYLVASLVATPVPVGVASTHDLNWCTVGYTVMVPDGREAVVTSKQGDICRVMAAGEGYVTLLPYYIVEPVYPQNLRIGPFGH